MSTEKDPSQNCWNCAEDPTGKLKQMFVDIVQNNRIKLGQNPARRPVFLKLHGVAHGWFEMNPDLPPDLKVGIFSKDRLRAWVRFSSDTTPTMPDLRTTCGIGIKLFGVPGPKLLGDGDTQDFLLQNFDVFFVDTAIDMCEFTKAGVVDGNYEPYLKTHPVTDHILKEMQKVELSTLTTTYWSVLPYAFGKDRYVKYKLEPETPVDSLPSSDPNYLAADLARRLRAGDARFRFMVQFRTDPEAMPLDHATVRWEESESKPVQIATLILPRQNIEALGQSTYGENLAFNPWHSLAEHEPQGTISAARKVVYAASAENRHDANGVPGREPGEPRPFAAKPEPDDCIVRAAIYPSIGVARVGNAETEYVLGPEVADPLPLPLGSYRDSTGALKRQAARFRIYGLNAEGKAVRELTPDNAQIHWTVHLANKKSAWYQFQIALDIPEAGSASPSLLRNAAVADRASLVIDPGPRHIAGKNTHGGKAHTFDTGLFVGKPVYLGELQTDPEGRLIVLGGHGKSASFDGTRAVTFANNEGWHDDTSDGPVTANVEYRGQKLKVDPAWIVVAPPDYAPQQKSVRTMWDLMRDVAIQNKTLPWPARPSFNRDIRPIFERLSNLQWVNKGYAAAFGWAGWSNLATPYAMLRLSANNPDDQEFRQTVANTFRVFDRDSWAQQLLPWNYGDAMDIPPVETPRQNASLTDTQLRMLQQWAKGDFDADYNPAHQPPRYIEELPVEEQPDMLNRGALEFCLADAFHPGCEMTWPVRAASIYMAPFRFAHATKNWVEPSFGEEMTSSTLSLPNGPLGGQLPGGITRWMAIPWQTDTASCRSGYQKTYDPYVPTFWPARVPNQVLSKENYDIVMNAHRPLGERLAAFANRADWIRPLGSKTYTDQINNMVAHYGNLGVLEVRPGPGDPHFPDSMEVENLPSNTHRMLASADTPPFDADQVDLTVIEKVHRFPHGLKR